MYTNHCYYHHYAKLHLTVKSLFTVVFPAVKITSMVVSLYSVIVLVVDYPMYENPVIFKYILAIGPSALKPIIDLFAVNCVSVQLFKSSSLIISLSPHLNTLASKLP